MRETQERGTLAPSEPLPLHWELTVGLRREKRNSFSEEGNGSLCPNSKLLSSDAVVLNSSLNIGVRGRPGGVTKLQTQESLTQA